MFRDYTIRDYMQVSYLMLRPEVTVERFSRRFEMSRYEYAACQQRMKEMQALYGVEFEFGDERIGWHKTDEARFNLHYKGIWAFYNRHRHQFMNDEEQVRGLYMAKTLLLAPDCTDLETLAEDMGFSRSSLRNAIKLCRNFLASYNIRLENVPHHGVRPAGSEWNIRRCLIAIYMFLEVNVVPEEDHPEIARRLSGEDYTRVRSCLREVLRGQGGSIAQTQLRRLNYYVAFLYLRVQAGHPFAGFAEVDPQIVAYAKASPRLQALSREILRRVAQLSGCGPCPEAEADGLAMMLLEALDAPDELNRFVQVHFPDEFRSLSQRMTGFLHRRYGLQLTGRFDQLLQELLSGIVLRHRMNILSERAGSADNRTPRIANYPLMEHLYRELRGLLKEHYGEEAAAVCCTPLCDLIAFFIQCSDYEAPRLRIALALRTSLYDPALITEILQQRLDPRYYKLLERRPYDVLLDDLEQTRRQYDVVICDERLSGDALFLSYQEFRNDFDNLNSCLRMLRNLCGGLLRDADICPQDLDLRENAADWALLQQHLQERAAVPQPPAQLLQEAVSCGDCMVLVLPQHPAGPSLLQFGELKKKMRVENRRVTRYLVFAGQIGRKNIRIVNELLYELVQDPLFWATLTETPTVETVNNQLNRLLK